MRHLALIVTLFYFSTAYTQDPNIRKLKEESSRTIKKETNKDDTSGRKWKRGGLYSINISQGTLSNWAAGGDDFSLSINSLLSLFAFYNEGHHSLDNTFDLNFGYINTTSSGSRKNDDRIDFLSKYGYSITPKINVASVFNFRSQLFKGFNYPNDSTKVLSSAFLSPANMLLSLGLNYKPDKSFSVFVSPITSRFIIVRNDTLAAKGSYGVEKGKNVKTEIGAFLTANYLKSFNKVVSYKSRLDMFSNFRNNPENIDVFWTNLLAVKLSKVFSVSWNVDVIYDDDVRIFGENRNAPATQIKSIVGIGLMLKF